MILRMSRRAIIAAIVLITAVVGTLSTRDARALPLQQIHEEMSITAVLKDGDPRYYRPQSQGGALICPPMGIQVTYHRYKLIVRHGGRFNIRTCGASETLHWLYIYNRDTTLDEHHPCDNLLARGTYGTCMNRAGAEIETSLGIGDLQEGEYSLAVAGHRTDTRGTYQLTVTSYGSAEFELVPIQHTGDDLYSLPFKQVTDTNVGYVHGILHTPNSARDDYVRTFVAIGHTDAWIEVGGLVCRNANSFLCSFMADGYCMPQNQLIPPGTVCGYIAAKGGSSSGPGGVPALRSDYIETFPLILPSGDYLRWNRGSIVARLWHNANSPFGDLWWAEVGVPVANGVSWLWKTNLPITATPAGDYNIVGSGKAGDTAVALVPSSGHTWNVYGTDPIPLVEVPGENPGQGMVPNYGQPGWMNSYCYDHGQILSPALYYLKWTLTPCAGGAVGWYIGFNY